MRWDDYPVCVHCALTIWIGAITFNPINIIVGIVTYAMYEDLRRG